MWFHTAEGLLSQVPLNFTDLVEPDPYGGSCLLVVPIWDSNDLLGLVDLLRDLGRESENAV